MSVIIRSSVVGCICAAGGFAYGFSKCSDWALNSDDEITFPTVTAYGITGSLVGGFLGLHIGNTTGRLILYTVNKRFRK